MSRHAARLGAVLGGVSLVPVLASGQFALLRHPRAGHLLALADRFGLLRQPSPDALPELTVTSWLTVTDVRVIVALACAGGALAVLAMLLAIWADALNEESLGPGVGMICGGMALVVLAPGAGVGALGAGAAVLLARRRRRAVALRAKVPP